MLLAVETIECKKETLKAGIVYHLGTSIKVFVVFLKVSIVFLVRGVVQLTSTKAVTVRFFFNIETYTLVIQVTDPLACVNIFNMLDFNPMVLQTSTFEDAVIWKVELTISH